jgi:hypothetical protein
MMDVVVCQVHMVLADIAICVQSDIHLHPLQHHWQIVLDVTMGRKLLMDYVLHVVRVIGELWEHVLHVQQDKQQILQDHTEVQIVTKNNIINYFFRYISINMDTITAFLSISVIGLVVAIGFIIYISTKQPLQFKFILLLLLLFVLNNKVSQPLYLKEECSEEAKKAYFENLESGKILKNLIGNDVVFFTNGKYIIFNGTLNIMYGYDLHLERFTQVYMNIPIKSTMFKNASTEEYDEKFRNGFVQYIVVENNPIAVNQIEEYYTQYAFLQKAGNLLVYKYNQAL